MGPRQRHGSRTAARSRCDTDGMVHRRRTPGRASALPRSGLHRRPRAIRPWTRPHPVGRRCSRMAPNDAGFSARRPSDPRRPLLRRDGRPGLCTQHPEQVSGLVLLDPNSCFGPMRMQYLAHAVPILLRPSRSRQRTFLEWETGGAALDHQWLELSAIGAAHFPSTRPRVPRRPKTAALAELTVPVSVILAANSRVHDVGKIADSARNSLSHCQVDIIDGATHHSLPMLPRPAVTTVLTSACTQFAGGWRAERRTDATRMPTGHYHTPPT